MPQSVYDPEADEKHAPQSNKNQTAPSGKPYDTRGHDVAANDPSDSRGDNPKSQSSLNAKDLTNAETDRGQDTFNYTADNKNPNFLGRIKARARRRKILMIGSLGGGTLIIVLFLILVLGSLEIPDFASDMLAWQFARISRSFSQDAGEVTAEKMAIDADEDKPGLISKIKSTYGSLRDNTLGQFDDYRPQQIISKLESSGRLQYEYKTTLTGKRYMTAVKFDDESYPLANDKFLGQYHLLENFKYKVAAAQDFGDALSDALHDYNPLVRGVTMTSIFSKLGISLKAWGAGELADKYSSDQESADVQQEQDSVAAATDGESPTSSSVGEINDAANDVSNDIQQCNTNTACTQQEIDDGGQLPTNAVTDLDNDLSTSVLSSASGALKGLAGALSPTYTVALPLCIIYDGSIDPGNSSASTIDQSNAEAIRTGTYVDSSADQQETGSPYVTGQSVGAMNLKLNPVTQSNAYLRSSGETVDTSSDVSSETATGGDYTLFNTVFDPTVASFFSTYVSPSCSLLTNPYVGVGLGVVALLNPEEGILWQTIKDPTVTGITSFTRSFVGKIFNKWELTKLGVVAGSTLGLTLYAKQLVLNHAGVINDGAAVGTSYANEADMGNNLLANEEERDQFFGRPMTDQEIATDNQQSKQYLVYNNSQKSVTQRYFALDNPDSLFSKVGIDLYNSIFNKELFSTLLFNIDKILSPLSSLAHLFNILATPHALAATPVTSANSDYGDVQWGWSQSELNLINNSPQRKSYQPLENQAILDANSADESAIANYYGQTCYATDANASDPLNDGVDQSKINDMGELLANSDIVRNSSGDVVSNQGVCSPNNLGPNNTDPNAGCGSSGCGDLVFRWRLAMAYKSTLDQLNCIQSNSPCAASSTPAPAPTPNPSPTPSPTPSPSPTPTPPSKPYTGSGVIADPTHIIDAQWNFTGNSTLTNISVDMTVNTNGPPVNGSIPDGYFYANEFYFPHNTEDSHNGTSGTGYIGMQDQGNDSAYPIQHILPKSMLMVIYGASSGVAAPNGSTEVCGDPSGEGESCSLHLAYNWIVGHTYRFDISLKKANSDGNNIWSAQFTDLSSNATTQLGTIDMAASDGLLNPAVVTFHERFSGPTNSCSNIMPSAVTFTNVTTDNGSKNATPDSSFTTGSTTCTNLIFNSVNNNTVSSKF